MRQVQPLRSTYRAPFITSRMSTVRGRPPVGHQLDHLGMVSYSYLQLSKFRDMGAMFQIGRFPALLAQALRLELLLYVP